MNCSHLILLTTLASIGWAIEGRAAEDSSPKDVAFFESKIRPVLVKYCYECHSANSKEVGGKLLLDSREAMRMGGESGPALVPGKPIQSLIVQALRYDGIEMPPKQPLPEQTVNDFAHWVKQGAVDPRSVDAVRSKEASKEAQALWSLKPARKTSIPSVKDRNWPHDSIDNFVLSKIEMANLRPTADADARTLSRRLHFDLTGLPPSMERTQRFVEEHAVAPESAIATLVDELLASPQFGERWGRHWLDVARYGESNGNDGLGRNPTFPHAWRYRDYVINSFNNDVPYDRFLREQIAGDLLPAETPQEKDNNLIATGFLAIGAKPAKAMNTNFDMDVVADQIDVIGSGVMGLSVACARCHDHKFDPIPTRDYYALAGFFTSTETMWGVAANEGLTAPKTDLHVLKATPRVPPPKDFVETVLVRESATGILKPIPKSPWPVGTPLAMGVRDRQKPADCKVNIKGDAKKLGEVIPRGFLTACHVEGVDSPGPAVEGSGRLELARWLTGPNHPLTARVMVNRIWQQLYGTGIVGTPNDFGIYGERPTHPQLLDHLAIRFVEGGWSMKKLIRSILLTHTYRLSSDVDANQSDADDGIRLLTRHQRRRLDAEALRDNMLAASGEIELSPAEGSLIRHRDILVNLAGNLHKPSHHRSVYLCYLRSSPPPELAAFDLPDFTTVTGQRHISTVPNQALHLYNNPFVIEQARCFAERIVTDAETQSSRIELAWNRAFSRSPTDDEVIKAAGFLKDAEDELRDQRKAWASLCQALLATNEFRYID